MIRLASEHDPGRETERLCSLLASAIGTIFAGHSYRESPCSSIVVPVLTSLSVIATFGASESQETRSAGEMTRCMFNTTWGGRVVEQWSCFGKERRMGRRE